MAATPEKITRAIYITAISLIGVFGLLTYEPGSRYSEVLGVIYLVPAIGFFIRNRYCRLVSLWFGLLMVAQTILSSLLYPYLPYLMRLPLNTKMSIETKGYHGIAMAQTVTTDEKGYRTTKQIDYSEKGENELRIFAVGGSTTEQIMLDDKKTSFHLLQTALEDSLKIPVSVINTGVSGLRSPHHLATLHDIEKYDPDIAVILLGINDWNDHIRSYFEPRNYSHERTPTLRSRLYFINSMLGQLSQGIKRTLFVDKIEANIEANKVCVFAPANSLSKTKRHQFLPESVSPEYKYWLETILTFCNTSGIECLVVSQPTGYSPQASADFRESFWMTPPDADYTLDIESLIHISRLYNNYLLQEAGSFGVAYCDAASGFTPSFDSFYDDCHFNESGAKHLSELLFPHVVELAGGP